MIEKLLSALDDDQRAAVTAPLSNILCIANAGSGKTRVLVHRIAYWILMGQPEDSFMMLTFTNKAANEMMDRTKALLDKETVKILGGTFHSVAVKLLRKYGGAIGIRQKFQILDSTDAAGLMGVCREKLCADYKLSRKDFPPKEELARFYSYCRNCCISPEEHNERTLMFTDDDLRLIFDELIPSYEARKEAMGALDFDDLLVYFNRLLDHPGILRLIHTSYPNVFVDEYQDINALQNQIIHKLAQEVNHLTVVGDEAQCIYGFRGSEVAFIQAFKDDYGDAGVFPIRNNYRSVDGVVDLALSVINRSPDYEEHKKVMIATSTSPVKPKLVCVNDDFRQNDYIYNEIIRARSAGIHYGEMAILFRTGFLARGVEADLVSRGIPVTITCGISFYERLHVRAVLDFLKFLDNPTNEIAFWNLFETIDGIGPKTAQKMFQAFGKEGCDFEELYKLKVPAKANNGMNAMLSAIKTGRAQPAISDQIDVFMCKYYRDAIMRIFPEDFKKRLEDLKILRRTVEHFDSLEDFLENIALSSAEESGLGDKVLITTVHKAKGLEWDKVFLPYMNDGIFPHYKCEEVEEERRLLYVAITRARKELSMIEVSFSSRLPDSCMGPSPFLKDIPVQRLGRGADNDFRPSWNNRYRNYCAWQ